MAKTNILNDEIFKTDYYAEFVSKIKSNIEYQRMESVVNEKGLKVIFGFSKIEDRFTTQYGVGFEIHDVENIMISVPQTSRFYDYLGNLFFDFTAVVYHKFSKKIAILAINDEELCDDCKLISAYLSEEQTFEAED